MMHCFLKTLCTLVVGALLWLGSPAQAQIPGSVSDSGFNLALMKLLSGYKAFTAEASVRVTDKDHRELAATPMTIAFLNDKARMEVDMTKMKTSALTPEMLDGLRKSGMAEVTTIVRPDKRSVYVVFPADKSLLRMAMDEREATAALGTPKITRTLLGTEKIAGKTCEKHKVNVTDAAGQSFEAITWNDKSLKDFPVQIESSDKGNTSLLQFRDVKFTPPEPGKFEPPTGLHEFKNLQDVATSMMLKMSGLTGTRKQL